MAGLANILRYQWIAYWRRNLLPGKFNRANQGLFVLIGGLSIVKYFSLLLVATSEIQKGKTAKFEILLVIIFLAWTFLVMSSKQLSIHINGLSQFPLSARELFAIRTISLLMPPGSIAVSIISLALSWTIAHAVNPIAGIIAVWLFIAFSLFAGMSLFHVMSAVRGRVVIFAALIIVVISLGWLYAAKGISGNWLNIVSFSPLQFVVKAGMNIHPLRSILLLTLITTIALSLAYRLFASSLQTAEKQSTPSTAGFGSIHFPGRIGGLVKKDLRYFRRLLDPYLAVAISLATGSYLVFSVAPSAGFVWVALIGVFLGNADVAFNSFGLESAGGFDRYALFPLSSRLILRSKNSAFLVVIAMLTVPIAGLSFWRFGFTTGAVTVIEVALLALANLTWGNVMSVTQPSKRYFFRFSSGGSPVSVLGGAIFGSLPGLLMLRFLLEESPLIWWQIAGMIVVYTVLYLASTSWSATYFERHRDRIRLSLS